METLPEEAKFLGLELVVSHPPMKLELISPGKAIFVEQEFVIYHQHVSCQPYPWHLVFHRDLTSGGTSIGWTEILDYDKATETMETMHEEANTVEQNCVISYPRVFRQPYPLLLICHYDPTSGRTRVLWASILNCDGATKVMANIKRIQQGHAEKERSWCDLPDDLLSEIFSRLFPRERVVFKSISKSWNSVGTLMSQRFVHPGDIECLIPSLLFANNRIFHPIYEDCHYIGSPDITSAMTLSGTCYNRFYHRDFLDKDGTIVRVAKNGWLLMTLEVAKIFFFNPITKEKIQLPDLNDDAISADFSSTPTSKDWSVVVTVISYHDDYHWAIMNMKCGDKSWNYYDILVNGEVYQFSYCNPVVFEGLYYFLGENPTLLIHNPVTRESIVHEAPKSVDELNSSYGEQYLLVGDGKILTVYVGCDGQSVRVFEWNVSKKKWETVESLGDDKMIFVSRPASLCVKASSRKGIGNRIYVPRLVGSHCLYYSLNTKRLHTSTFVMDTCYRNFGGSKEYLDATWIMPTS